MCWTTCMLSLININCHLNFRFLLKAPNQDLDEFYNNNMQSSHAVFPCTSDTEVKMEIKKCGSHKYSIVLRWETCLKIGLAKNWGITETLRMSHSRRETELCFLNSVVQVSSIKHSSIKHRKALTSSSIRTSWSSQIKVLPVWVSVIILFLLELRDLKVSFHRVINRRLKPKEKVI